MASAEASQDATKAERLEPFLVELRALYEKHGVFIGACQCCNSPWVVEPFEGSWTLDDAVEHLRKQGLQ